METILNDLLYLGILIIINIALGLYHNIGQESMIFDWKIFLNGLIKACIIGGSFVGLAFVFGNTDLSSIGITPDMIMNLSLILYATKCLNSLMEILGVTIDS